MGLTPHQFARKGFDMSKSDTLNVCRKLALASAKPGFDPAEIRAWEEEIREAGWKFECIAKLTFAATAPDGDAWVVKAPQKGRQKTVAYTMEDFALYEAAGNFVSTVSDMDSRRQADSTIRAFEETVAQISAKSLVAELEDGMARAVEELRRKLGERPEEFAPEEFAEAHGLEYRSTGLNEWVSGETRPYRDELKAHGFKWAQKRKAWYRRAA